MSNNILKKEDMVKKEEKADLRYYQVTSRIARMRNEVTVVSRFLKVLSDRKTPDGVSDAEESHNFYSMAKVLDDVTWHLSRMERGEK